MNKLFIGVIMATSLIATDRFIPVNGQTVDSDKAEKSVWYYTNFARQVKRELATFQIIQSTRQIKKKKIILEPLLKHSLILDLTRDCY